MGLIRTWIVGRLDQLFLRALVSGLSGREHVHSLQMACAKGPRDFVSGRLTIQQEFIICRWLKNAESLNFDPC